MSFELLNEGKEKSNMKVMGGGFLKLKGFQSPMTSFKPEVILNIMQSTELQLA